MLPVIAVSNFSSVSSPNRRSRSCNLNPRIKNSLKTGEHVLKIFSFVDVMLHHGFGGSLLVFAVQHIVKH